jgi:Spy/CpxP family protein refolding chaperone
MPLSCKTALLRKRWTALSLSVTAVVLTQGAIAADTGNDSQKTIIPIPSSEDFVRPAGPNTDGFVPRHGDFRYMKMDYATTQRDPSDTTKDNTDTTQPPAQKKLPPPGTLPAGPPIPPGALPPRPPEGGPPRSMRGPSLDLTPLNLTADQRQKFQDNRRETAKKMMELHKALKAKRDELNNALFDPDSTETTLRDKREEVTSLREQMDDLKFEELMTLRGLLTAEQRKHLPEIKPQFNKPPAVADSGKGALVKSEGPGKTTTVTSVKGDVKPDTSSKIAPKAIDTTPKQP